MDMSEIPVEAIYKGVRKFKCAPRESHYETILSPGECEFAQRKDDDVEVRCCKTYNDIELKRLVKTSERLIMKRERADHLEGMGLVEIME